MSRLDELIGRAKPRETVVSICFRGDLVDRHDELERQMATGSGEPTLSGNPQIVELANEIDQVEQELEAESITVRVRGLSRKAWADLLAAHPPSREQLSRGLDNDERTFPAAAIAACADEPALTVEKAEELAEHLPVGEWMKLWMAVLGLNLGSLQTPKSAAAAAVRHMNGASLVTPPTEESPAASS